MSLYKFCIIFFHFPKLKISIFHIPAFPVVSIFLWDAYLFYINYDHLIYLTDLCWAFERAPFLLFKPTQPSMSFEGLFCCWTISWDTLHGVDWWWQKLPCFAMVPFATRLSCPSCTTYSLSSPWILDVIHPSWFWTLSKIILLSSLHIFPNPETHGRFLYLNNVFDWFSRNGSFLPDCSLFSCLGAGLCRANCKTLGSQIPCSPC